MSPTLPCPGGGAGPGYIGSISPRCFGDCFVLTVRVEMLAATLPWERVDSPIAGVPASAGPPAEEEPRSSMTKHGTLSKVQTSFERTQICTPNTQLLTRNTSTPGRQPITTRVRVWKRTRWWIHHARCSPSCRSNACPCSWCGPGIGAGCSPCGLGALLPLLRQQLRVRHALLPLLARLLLGLLLACSAHDVETRLRQDRDGKQALGSCKACA
jgi:hypothetical protein